MPTKASKAFSRQWYADLERAGRTGFFTTWRGHGAIKCPLDMWIYQEIIWKTKPTLIIETGAYAGGSAFFMADVLNQLGEGRVLSIELSTRIELPEHDRIDWLIGASSTSDRVMRIVRDRAEGQRVMVVLDSDHAQKHVLEEMRLYAPLVSTGCYLIVEDTNTDCYFLGGGYPDGGPAEAVKEFQPTNKGFEVDRNCERLGFTQNPGGFLRRVR